jgi:hypothetical protein
VGNTKSIVTAADFCFPSRGRRGRVGGGVMGKARVDVPTLTGPIHFPTEAESAPARTLDAAAWGAHGSGKSAADSHV